MEITFKKHVINKAVPAKAKRRLPPSLPGADGSLKSLQEKIAKDAPNLLWNRYSGGKKAPLQNISAIPDIEDLLSLKCIEMFKKKLSEQMPLSDVERASVCERTIGQNENAEWMKERTGRLTASNFHRIIHCVKPEGLVKDILYPRKQGPLKQGDPRLYGLENEDLAVNAYKTVMLLYDKDIQLVKTGLHVDVTHSFVAASPDRIVKDGSDVGLLEVKCPASKAGQAVLDACMDKTFWAEVVDGEVRLKRTHTYFYQVQGQLGVTQKPWCDFVIWTNHADLHQSVTIERIYFDEVIWKKILEGLLYFYRMAVIPELLTKRIRRLGFLYTTGTGYVPFKKYKEGFYFAEEMEPLKLKLRKLN